MKTGKKRVIELTWICSTCGKENRGRDMRCAGCGKTKNDEKYVMPDNTELAPTVTDPDMLRQANAGKNWTCEYCGSQERNLNGQCKECGGDKAEPVKPEPATIPPEPDDEPKHLPSCGSNTKRILFYAGAGIGGIAVVGLLVWLGIYLFGTHEVEAQIAAISWQHSVTLEQRYTLNGSGWDSDMPAGAFNVSCRTKQHGTERCNPYDCNPHQEQYDCNPHECNSRTETYDCDPYECNCTESCHEDCTDDGNGYATCEQDCDRSCDTCYETCTREVHDTCYDTCERTEYDTCYEECPVYDQWCTYNYYEWQVVRTVRTIGTTHDESWPDPLNTFALSENQRLQKTAIYRVNFQNGEDGWNYVSPNLQDFRRFNPHERWLLKVDRAGTVWPQKRI